MMRRWSVGLVIAALVGLVGCGPGGPAPAARAPGGGGAPAASAPAPAPAAPASAPAAGAEPAAPPPRVALRVGLNAVSASIAPLWLALDAGIFDQHGFDVEFITLQSSSQVAKVMASGEIPIALSAAAGVVDAALAGDDQVLISGIQNYMNFWVYARPGITSIAQLRDKRVGTSRIGSGAHLALVEMFRRNGLEPDRDVAIMQIGGMPEISGALNAGAVDAGILSIPWNFRAHDEGMTLIYDVSAQRIPYLQNGLATSRAYIARNEDIVRRFMAAHVEGLARVHKDKATTVEVLARNLKSEDLALMQRTYDLIAPLFERIPYPTAESIQTVIDQRAADNPAARNLTPAQLSEERFLRELEQSGFVNRVYN